MNAKERKKLARAIAHRADSMKDVRLEKSIATALTGCTARAYKATMPIPIRSTERPSADNICLPEVAKFAAGFRKVREDCYHVIK
ncbi:TPA: transcriptional regulator [Yersinia enterocolitica]|nr:transcriptional regulator [Yersinia enterocolitica]